MNCEEYRQAIAAEPSFDGADEHLSQCAACQAFRDEMRALDRRIGRALEIDVPALSMPDLDTDKKVVTFPRRRLGAPAWFAVAATILVAAMLGVRMYVSTASYPSLADEILAHLDHEPYALRVTDKPVSARRLGRVVPADVARMDHGAGLITYAQTCVINGKEVPHLVIQGERGPVTILLMPDETIPEAVQLDGENINGVILPVGDGSIAIIGEGDERLDEITESVVNSVMWTA